MLLTHELYIRLVKFENRVTFWAYTIVQWANPLDSKLNVLSSIPQMHVANERNESQKLSSDLYMYNMKHKCMCKCASTHSQQMNKHNRKLRLLFLYIQSSCLLVHNLWFVSSPVAPVIKLKTTEITLSAVYEVPCYVKCKCCHCLAHITHSLSMGTGWHMT